MTKVRYIPTGATLVDAQGTDAAVYTYEARGLFLAIGYHGKATKSDFHYSYRNVEQRDKQVASFIESRKAHSKMMDERKAERCKPHSLNVGDVLVCSWGYDQTNIDFYQVTRVVSQVSVEIQSICKESHGEDGFMTGKCSPVRDAFKGKPMVKRVSADNWVRISSYSAAGKWDGKPERESWYA